MSSFRGFLAGFPGRLFPRAGEGRERAKSVGESDFFGVSRVLRPLLSSPVCAAVDLEHRIFAMPPRPLLSVDARRGTDHHSLLPAELPCGRETTNMTLGPHVIPSQSILAFQKEFVPRFHDGRRLLIQCHFLPCLASHSDLLNTKSINHRSR